jgi:hypothetical protein
LILLRSIILIVTLILSPICWGQDYIVDPDFADLGNRYFSRVMGIEYESETNTYMVAGTFAGGEPFTPCLNRINELGEDDFFWNPENPESCSGVLNNFFRVPNGYRFGANMIKRNDEGVLNTNTIPDFTGTEQIAVSGARGWADDNGAIYVGSNWRLLEEEGQPETGLLVFTPQGERYEPFPIVRCGHPSFISAVWDIYEYDEDRLMLGGSFDSLNGHLSIRMARIFKDGTVDTSFSSQLEKRYVGITLDVDPQGRMLVHQLSGGSESAPNDHIELWRLMPDGSLDPTWNPVDLANSVDNTTGSAARTAIRMDDGSYIIYGKFRLVNGQPRNAICRLDSTGMLMDTFEGEAFETDLEAHPQLSPFGSDPHVMAAAKTPDGGLLIGGRFTHYQDQPYLNLIKLIPDSTVGTTERDFPVKMKIYPNPATDRVTIQQDTERSRSDQIESIRITDLSGRMVASFPWNGDNASYDVSHLAKGVYVVQIMDSDTVIGLEKLVIH